MEIIDFDVILSEMICDLEEIQRQFRKDRADKAELVTVLEEFLNREKWGRSEMQRPLYEMAEKAVKRAKEQPC
jgi:hypothetical protein